MATAETAIRPHDRQKGRRPFATWMKRLANLKSSGSAPHSEKKSLSRNKRRNNNPYPESGHVSHKPAAPSTISGRASSFTPASVTSGRVNSFASYDDSTSGGANILMRSNKSTAPTLATNPETIHSDTGFSRAGTTYTDGIYSGRANSTFSSARASQESLTTTLTTIQSTAPSAMLPANTAIPAVTQSPVSFSHQYPVSPPASAVPSHLQQSSSQPHTYTAATANGLLSDNASILTLASSSKRRRRNSLDTQASIRAIAPSSVWGNSRESLPLSVLSANIDREPTFAPGPSSATASAAAAAVGRPSLSGLASAERASVYSNPGGVGAPALISERNSYYSAKLGNDGASVRSVRSGHVGHVGHGRTDSINGSITGLDRAAAAVVERCPAASVATSPLATPREGEAPGRASRRTSGWREGGEDDVEEEEEEGEGEGDGEDAREQDDEDEHGSLAKVDKMRGKGKGKENFKEKTEKDGSSGTSGELGG